MPDMRGAVLATAYRFRQFSILKCRACDNSWRTNLYSPSDIVAMYAGEEYAHNPYFSCDVKQFRSLARERFNNFDSALTIIESFQVLTMREHAMNVARKTTLPLLSVAM